VLLGGEEEARVCLRWQAEQDKQRRKEEELRLQMQREDVGRAWHDRPPENL
jgi:hypothetical protein